VFRVNGSLNKLSSGNLRIRIFTLYFYILRSFLTLPRYSYVVLLLFATVYFVQGDRYFGYTSKLPKTPVNVTSDGTGYYAYLPHYVVYNSKKPFDFIDTIVKKYPDKNLNSMLGYDNDRRIVTNKFYVGTPLLQSPFYLAAHNLIKISGKNADGYSRGYRLSIQLASLFWVLVGCIALIHFLHSLGVSHVSSFIATLLIAFGTNLNTYTVYVPSMSHAYSFSMIALFLYVASKWSNHQNSRQFILLSLLLGVIAIVRPVNLLILFFIPFLFPDFSAFLNAMKELFRKKFSLLVGSLIFISIVFIQLYIHHDLCGTWSLYTYSGEGFDNWYKPQFFNVLFSSEKGFFLYGPVLLFIIPGLFSVFKTKGRYFTFGWLLFILGLFYMISSWWDWAYGGSLGMRPLVEFLPVLVIPIAFLMDRLFTWKRNLFWVFSGAFLIQFQFFQYQFNQHILPYSHVTWEQLARIQWKTAPRFEWMFYYDNDSISSNLILKKIGTSFYKSGWTTKSQFSTSNLDSVSSCIAGIKQPLCGKLSGEVMIYSANSNPTIYMDYFNKGEKVRSSVQPFGNQIEKLNTWTSVRQSYNTNIPFDSIVFRLENFGQTNSFRKLQIDWFTEK